MNENSQFYTNGEKKSLVRCACEIGCWCGELGFHLCDEEDNKFGFWMEVFIGPTWDWRHKWERIRDIILGRPFSMYMTLSKEDSAKLASWIQDKQRES